MIGKAEYASIAAAADGYRPISDYGIIGDTRGVALVSSHGSIDWCALPHLDSPPFFLKILDAELGGNFQIRPADEPFDVQRRYIDDSNVLRTRYITSDGAVELTDCFTVASVSRKDEEPPHEILRLTECTSGSMEIALSCRVTPGYARLEAPCELVDGFTARWKYEGGEVWITGNWPFEVHDDGETLTCTCMMHTGDRLYVVLSDTRPNTPVPGEVRKRINDAVNFWRQWVRECPYFGMYREMVIRSALTLKLLTFRPTGAIIAAATTSLPEEIGGERNWDYRYTWIRDATLTLWSFGLIGFYDEAHDFMHWIQERCFGRKHQLQIMYGIRGETELTETTLDHLAGYRDSKPVRIGNGAYDQQQLDIYGEIFDTAYLYYSVWGGLERYHPDDDRIDAGMWKELRKIADEVCDVWMTKDQGIWEVRGGPQHFVHSKVMCWVALQRAARLARKFKLPGDIERWSATRDEIRRTTLERGYNEEIGAFVQAYDSTTLDASALLFPMVHFIKTDDPRMEGTVDAIQRDLTHDGLVYRYRVSETDDGVPGGEGTFTICSFWLVDNLAFLGRIDEARELLARLIGYSNDLGLYSEEIDARTGEFLGNFPQAFTHMALINAAVNIDKAEHAIRSGRDGRVRPGVRRSRW